MKRMGTTQLIVLAFTALMWGAMQLFTATDSRSNGETSQNAFRMMGSHVSIDRSRTSHEIVRASESEIDKRLRENIERARQKKAAH